MKRTPAARSAPPAPNRRTSTTAPSPRVSTVPLDLPPPRRKSPKPAARVAPPRPAIGAPKPTGGVGRRVAQIVDRDESTLLDLIDNLLSKGVVLNADLILALANVDLVYVRLSALVCAADRILPGYKGRGPSRRGK